VRSFLYFILAIGFAWSVAIVLAPQRPVSAASKARARGAEVFNTHSCAKCHGTNGVNGDRAPDLQEVRKRMNAAAIANQIRNGGKGMPPFGDQLSDREVEDLVAYLRTKRKVIIPPPPAAPDTGKDPGN
jgi:mono/diheme cytochrome c family protein